MIELSLTSIYPYVRMAARSKAPDSRCYSFSVREVSGFHMEAWVQIPLLTTCLLQLEAVVETAHIIFFSVYYASDQCQ